MILLGTKIEQWSVSGKRWHQLKHQLHITPSIYQTFAQICFHNCLGVFQSCIYLFFSNLSFSQSSFYFSLAIQLHHPLTSPFTPLALDKMPQISVRWGGGLKQSLGDIHIIHQAEGGFNISSKAPESSETDEVQYFVFSSLFKSTLAAFQPFLFLRIRIAALCHIK